VVRFLRRVTRRSCVHSVLLHSGGGSGGRFIENLPAIIHSATPPTVHSALFDTGGGGGGGCIERLPAIRPLNVEHEEAAFHSPPCCAS